jgi:hypothetical protein
VYQSQALSIGACSDFVFSLFFLLKEKKEKRKKRDQSQAFSIGAGSDFVF